MWTVLARSIARTCRRTRSVKGPPSRWGRAPARGEPGGRPPEARPPEDVRAPAVADLPAAIAGRREDEGDRPLAVGRVLHGVGEDRVDERLRHLPAGSLGWPGLRPQARLAVGAVAGPQLVEPAAADAGLAAQLGHRRLAPFGSVDERLPQACETVGRGHGPSSAVSRQTNSVRVASGPFSMSAVSGFTVGCKA